MATNAVIDLKNYVPNIIKDQPLWDDFLSVVSDELDLMRVEIELKKRLLNIELYTDIEELLALGRSLGYSANLLLIDELSTEDQLLFVQQEVSSIVFKIKAKASYAYFNYLFKLIPRLGTTFILFQDYLHLARAIDYTSTFTNLSTHDWSLPFTGVKSILHYDEYNDVPVSLDADPVLDLDSAIEWYLDQDVITKPTQHLVLEYIINSLVQNEKTENCLLTDKYLKYLATGVHYGRKVTNTPHVGFNISFLMHKDGDFAHYSSDAEYSIPLLQVTCVATNNFDSSTGTIEENFNTLVIGTGTNTFGGDINNLANEIFRQEISTNQIEENSYWVGSGMYPYNSISNEILAVGDDSFTELSDTLNYNNLAPGTLNISYYSLPDYYTITSDKKGNLICDAATGTIDFETGDYEIEFSKDSFIFKEVISPGGVSSINYTASNTNLKPSSIGINYTISGSRYEMILDNGSGEFINTGISSSSIDYALGLISITFTDTTELEEIYISYYHTKFSKPTSETNIEANYKVQSGLEITEAGLLNEDGLVTAYATFPKSEVDGIFNHMSMQFFVEV